MPTADGFAASAEMIREIEHKNLTNHEMADLLEELEQSDNSIVGAVELLTSALIIAFRRLAAQEQINAK